MFTFFYAQPLRYQVQLCAVIVSDTVWQKIFKKKFGYMWKVYYICSIKSKMLIT